MESNEEAIRLNGQFAWLEELTGIPIGGALLDLFAQAME